MRVIFKDEGNRVGPVNVIEGAAPEARPYQACCVCEYPKVADIHPNGGTCLNCGDWYQPWYRIGQAKEIASYYGVELEEA